MSESKSKKEECVKVVVRCRPPNKKEIGENATYIVTVDSKARSVCVAKPPAVLEEELARRGGMSSNPSARDAEMAKRTFWFDCTYGQDSIQSDVFEEVAKPIVDSVLSGYNGTIFAYGQTGTGKTFTMEGAIDNPNLRGIMPSSFYHIIDRVKNCPSNVEFLVRVSFLEIYNDDVFDLLNTEERKKLSVHETKETGVFVKGLSSHNVKSVDDLMRYLRQGQKSRRTGATKMNEGSSRSHSILTITVESSETDEAGNSHVKSGKLNLIDLAGSERQKKTETTGDAQLEGIGINRSLLILGNCIKALTSGQSHIPFRDCKLTRLLQDSLGGNTKTVVVACIGPADYNYEETIGTLKYADRAKQIKNKPTVNEDPKDAMIRKYLDELGALKAEVERRRQGLAPGGPPGADGGPEEIEEREVIQVVEQKSEEELKRIEEEAQAERLRLEAMSQEQQAVYLENKRLAEERAKVLASGLTEKELQLERDRRELAELEARIRAREQDMIVGGQQMEKAALSKLDLQRTEGELEAKRLEQERLKKELDEAEEAELYMNQQFQNRQQELSQKQETCEKLQERIRAKAGEIAEMEEEFEVEREDIRSQIRELEKEIKLKNLILNSYMPAQYQAIVESHAQWDELTETWLIPAVQLTSNNIRRPDSRNRPMTGGMSQGFGYGANFDPAGTGSSAQYAAAGLAAMPPRDVFFSYNLNPEEQARRTAKKAPTKKKGTKKIAKKGTGVKKGRKMAV